MSNTYFKFKQFTVHQERCAMKVCTDACLFGAWVARKLERDNLAVDNILDIGAGTGLLSLMLAQQTTARIDAIEMDEHAAEQAAENFESGPWKEKLQLIQGDARLVHLGRKYGLIMSNPPFFENDLKSPDDKRNLALHSASLSLEELLAVITANLAHNGIFAVLLPYHRKNELEELAAGEGFYLSESVSVRQTPAHSFFRAMMLFGPLPVEAVHSTLTIREGDQYSAEFADLLRDYYLKL